jgi:Holliday junction resolvase
MQTRKEKGQELELIILDYLKVIDNYARLSRASGASLDIGDVVSKYFFIEAKNWNKRNIIVDQDIWEHLINQIPISSNKIPLLIQKNNEGKTFVSLDIKDFFSIIYKAYKE